MDNHVAVCHELHDIYVSKNADYGDSFGDTYRELGIISAVTRIVDKVNRLKRLCNHPASVADESMRDTLLDLANYAIMTVMEVDKHDR